MEKIIRAKGRSIHCTSPRGLWVGSALLVFAVMLCAQSYQGGVRGRITDEGGASIPGAKVVIRDQATNVENSTVTNEQGEYVFASLKPATYTMTAESSGFKRVERRGIVVETQGFHTIDLRLSIGELAQTIEVTSGAPLMETVLPSTGQTLGSRQLESLPNIGRNVFAVLAKVSPNVTPVGDFRFQRFQDQSGTSQVSIAGGPAYSNNFMLDGVPVTITDNRTSLIPSIEAVREVKVQANTYDAEMGRTGGGVFNTYLKSGTNEFHGGVFGYYRDPGWAANDFFRNRNGIPRPDATWKNFGAFLGGPVHIPKLYKGRNRTFFWLTEESYRQLEGQATELAVPTLAERSGDFSQSLNRTGALQQIFDPLTSRTDASERTIRDPFAGNRIPAARLNPIGLEVVKNFSAPSRTAAFHGALNYGASATLDNRGDQWVGKVDHVFANWWTASLSSIHTRTKEPSTKWFPTTGSPGQKVLFRNVDATQLNNTFILSPNSVLDIRWGFNRLGNEVPALSAGYNPTTLGFPSNYLQDIQYLKFPAFNFQYFGTLGSDSSTAWTAYHSSNLMANLSKLVGRHNLRWGAVYRIVEIDTIPFGHSAGEFTFNDTFTRADYRTFEGRTGSDLAALLLGNPNSGTAQTSTKFFQFLRYYAGYFQDNYRIHPRLTLNLGLRYEWETGLADRNNALIVGFDREIANPIARNVTGISPRGGLLYAGVSGNKMSVADPTKTKFAPRLGVAWMVNDKTTVRGGYGLFWAPPVYPAYNSLGYTQVTEFVGTLDAGRTPNGSLSNPFPNGLLKPVGNALGLAAGIGQSFTFIDQFARSPYVHQFSIDVQRTLPGQIILTAGYVASRSRRLLIGTGSVNINQLPSDLFSLGNELFRTVENPFFGKGGVGILGSSTIVRGQLLRPHPQFGVVGRLLSDFNHARYDSLIFKADKRLSHGLTFVAFWTWSKNMDATFAPFGDQIIGTSSPQNSYDLESEYSLALSDVPHRFAGAVNYELPFGKGQPFVNTSRLLDHMIGGWQVNILTGFQSGFPLSIIQTNQNSVTGASVQRPNATGVSPQSAVADPLYRWINPAAFSQAPTLTFGNLSRTINHRGAGQANWDISLFKTFVVYERFRAQFRAEALNAFNTPMFAHPGTTLGTPAFGVVSRQKNYPRLVQLGLRFFF